MAYKSKIRSFVSIDMTLCSEQELKALVRRRVGA